MLVLVQAPVVPLPWTFAITVQPTEETPHGGFTVSCPCMSCFLVWSFSPYPSLMKVTIFAADFVLSAITDVAAEVLICCVRSCYRLIV
jgi:hypothetical protein